MLTIGKLHFKRDRTQKSPIKISARYFVSICMIILKCIWKNKGIRKAKIIFGNE